MTGGDPRTAVDEVWRQEAGRVLASLARFTGDVDLAEELAQESLVAALEQWPDSGVPANPGAWLTTVGKRRAVDLFRRNETLRRKVGELGRDLESGGAGATTEAKDSDDIGDDLLRLVFTACHPVLTTEGRVALTLKLVAGLTTAEIARAYLVSEPTVAQRIVRAKRTLADAQIPFAVPQPDEVTDRLTSVLEVVYLVFNEGYSATTGDAWTRPLLTGEALRLGRLLAELVPREPEVHGLLALMEVQASRGAARTGPSGEPVLLLDQDRSRWDTDAITRGLASLERAERLGGARGPYALQAAIAAVHARAADPADTDWERLVSLYDVMAEVDPSPVVDLNRAVAVSMAYGPAAGLARLDRLADEPALRAYHLLPSVRGDLLAKLGRAAEARMEFLRAASLTGNARERTLLLNRAEDAARAVAGDS